MRGAEAAREIPLIQENPGELSFEFDAVGTTRSKRGAVNMASPDYFRLMGIPLLHGRSFAAGDVRAATPAIVLSASLARALFGETDVVGRLVRPPSPGDDDVFHRVVGVVADVPRWRIEDGPAQMAYFPLLRDADGVPNDSVRVPILMHTSRYVLRTDAPVSQLAPTLRAAVRDRRARAGDERDVAGRNGGRGDGASASDDAAARGVRQRGAAAGCIGIYSIVSYTVAGRQREFGVRLALGAAPSRIQGMVLRDGLMLTALGVAVGLVLALSGAQGVRSLLYGVSAADPALYAAVTGLLVIVAAAATLAPARRAAHVDPAQVMRGE